MTGSPIRRVMTNEPDREVISDEATEQLDESGEDHCGGVHYGVRILRVDGGGQVLEDEG